MNELESLVCDRSILVCCGSGGVGKTTTSAALALAGAELGRRTCVVTIDPARRLADALDVSGVANVPHRIHGSFAGELHAVMLDARATFDELIRRYAENEQQRDRILANRLYRNLVSALSGTQEYMATEKLFELHESGAFDLIIIDTPPTRSALDFLDAPGRLAGFIDNRVFRLLLAPGRKSLRAMSVASQVLLKTIARVAGSEIVDDAIAFFQAFEGMEEGFRARAASVDALLRSDSTGFVLVATPRIDAVEEASFFADRLLETKRSIGALVVNRVHPDFGPPLPIPDGSTASAWFELTTNLAELTELARREEGFLTDLVQRIAPAPSVRVPYLDQEVHDLAVLGVVARHLLGRELP